MFTAFTLSTRELDSPELAAQDIARQMAGHELRKNTLGIVVCENEFADNGILKSVCDALPFSCIGCNTTASATANDADELVLSVMVITSDKCEFVTALSRPVTADSQECIRDMYRESHDPGREKPALALAFGPMLPEVNDESIIRLLDQGMEGGVPVFGSLGVHYEDMTYQKTGAIHDGAFYGDRVALALLYGDFKPAFATSTLPDGKALRQKAVVTKAENNLLVEVNNKPVLEYMAQLGLALDNNFIAVHSVPIILDLGPDHPPASRTVYGVSPEGHLICGGEVPEGAGLSMWEQDSDAVLFSAGVVMDTVLAHPDPRAVLVFSCHSRFLSLGFEEMAEFELAAERLNGKIPWLAAYSGGEICPATLGERKVNYIYSDTMVACVL